MSHSYVQEVFMLAFRASMIPLSVLLNIDQALLTLVQDPVYTGMLAFCG